MYHWDTPLAIHNLGTWNNEQIIEYFVEYADILFQLFGDRVKTWLTINEPLTFCVAFTETSAQMYGSGLIPIGISEYLCAHNVIKAHARVYRLYEIKYKSSQHGKKNIKIIVIFTVST